MATITLTFNSPINMSCKVNDIAYYTTISEIGGFDVDNNINLIGAIISIVDNGTTVTVKCSAVGEMPAALLQSAFVFFSKNNLVELKSVLGYYGQAMFRNNSPHPAEMFATACGIEESSK